MRIATNLALNTHRQAARAAEKQSTAMGRVSSGHRINRAADDAAGLSISESIRGQIGGLAQASRNAQDAISLLQTAEGALGEVSAILQRVRDLAVQHHSGTLTSDDQEAIQAEARELGYEAIEIADRTEFNGRSVFGRSETTRSFQVGAGDKDRIDVAMPSLRDLLGVRGITAGYRSYEYYAQPVDTTIEMTATGPGPDGTPVTTYHSYAIPANSTMEEVEALINSDPNSPVQVTARYWAPGNSYSFGFYNKGWGPAYETTASGASIEEYLPFHDRFPGREGAPAFELGEGVDIAQIDAAITAVAGARAHFGAAQNRLEHRTQNLLAYQENLTAAESRIRDADIAHEFAEMTKASILTQAATTMLAQANQAPRQVLSLLNA